MNEQPRRRPCQVSWEGARAALPAGVQASAPLSLSPALHTPAPARPWGRGRGDLRGAVPRPDVVTGGLPQFPEPKPKQYRESS